MARLNPFLALVCAAGFWGSSVSATAQGEPTPVGKIVISQSGIYRLELEHTAQVSGKPVIDTELFVKVSEADGKVTWEKLWSQPEFREDDIDLVSDSGRVIQFSIHKANAIGPNDTVPVQKDYASMNVWEADGRQMAGVDLMQQFGFKSLLEVRKGIMMAETVLVSTNPGVRKYKDLNLPYASDESYTLLFSDGHQQTFHVVLLPKEDIFVLSSSKDSDVTNFQVSPSSSNH